MKRVERATQAEHLQPTDLVPTSRLSRRAFVGTLSAAVGSAALQSCKAPEEKIIPYVERPPEVIPGVGQYYATSTTRGGYGVGLLVLSHTGRPTKIEGHPEHPASLGHTLVQEQAELLTLYDPDRAKVVRNGTKFRPWKTFVDSFALARGAAKRQGRQNTGTREVILLEPTASPLLRSLLDHLKEQRPEAAIYFDSSRAPINRWNAARATYGEVVEPQYAFRNAKLVLSLDANFLAGMPMSIRWSRDFADRRDIAHAGADMNRLYVVETAVSVTGATADHRLAVRASEVGSIAAAIIHALAEFDPATRQAAMVESTQRHWDALLADERAWIRALAKDLAQHRGASVVLVGDQQPEHVHMIGLFLNELLGNIGNTVTYTASPMIEAGGDAYSFDRFFQTLQTGNIETAFILGGNPAYSLPPDLHFVEHIARARERVYWSLYENETAECASWFINATHFLESWGAEGAYDGTRSLRQPLIRPLYDGKSVEEVLALLAGLPASSGSSLLRQHLLDKPTNEADFADAVRTGLIANSGLPSKKVELRTQLLAEALRQVQPRNQNEALELDLLPDPRIEDGRLSNNPWLLELPEPISKLVWDNAALIAPQTAKRLGVERGDVIEIRTSTSVILAPVFESPGQAPGSLVMWLGWGRSGSETNARGVGVNVGPLRNWANPWVTSGIEVRKSGKTHELVTTQTTDSMHGREIALRISKHEWAANPSFAQHLLDKPDTLFPDRNRGAPQWGMTIDLSRCTGCSTCVVACQAENNIPVVGKELVAMGREMHWLRIDSYHTGSTNDPRVVLQPMLCQHCEKAPCEYVCPVNATVHSSDGLNQMVYNRCVGTRFCSNNCPYKVRRFNYFDYNQDSPEVKRMAFNPDVTVRARGVMEKCSYCVQRIRRAQIDAKLDGRALADRDVQTACEQACPTGAIVFGQVSDPRSRVAQRYASLRTYAVLNELGTQPRTRYLARIDNLNEEIP